MNLYSTLQFPKLDNLQLNAVIFVESIVHGSNCPQIKMTLVNFSLLQHDSAFFHSPLLYCISFLAEHPPGGQVALQAGEDPRAIQRRKPQLIPSVHVC